MDEAYKRRDAKAKPPASMKWEHVAPFHGIRCSVATGGDRCTAIATWALVGNGGITVFAYACELHSLGCDDDRCERNGGAHPQPPELGRGGT